MASFRKLKTGKWRAELYCKGQRASKSFNSKAAAKEWAAETEYRLKNKETFVRDNKTMLDLYDRYIREVCPKKKGGDKETIRINMFRRGKLANYLASDISAKDINKWKEKRLTEVKPGTVNREMNTLSAIFRVAQSDWEWCTNNPVRGVSRPPSPKHRDRRISQNEINLILAWLNFEGRVENKRQEVACMFLIAIETAMRLGEIHSLTQKDIYLDQRYVTLGDTKNNDRRNVPLTLKAVSLLKIVYPDMWSVSKGSVTALFGKAAKNTGLEDLHFHDSRHEAITRLARKLDVLDLARMIGHRDPKSLMIYYNATAQEIASRLD